MTGTGARGPTRLAELDLLRFVAALAVVAFHYLVAYKSVWGQAPARLFPDVAPLAGLGILGVELFFMISGYVILMSVWGRSPWRFVRSRAVRLYPAYWASLLAIVAVYGLTGVTALDPRLGPGEYLVNATMAQRAFGVTDASGVYWSLWAELRFYLLILLLMLAGVTLRRCLVFMGVWTAAAVVAVVVPHPLLDLVAMPKYAAYFVGGMAFFLISRFGSSLILWAFAGGAWVFALYTAIERVEGRVDLVGRQAMPVSREGVAIAITVIFLLMAAVALGWLRRVRGRVFGVLGAVTYPLYLFHSTVAAVMIPALRERVSAWVLVLATTAVAIALSYAVYRLVERPVQRLFRESRRAATRDPATPRRALETAGTPDGPVVPVTEKTSVP